MRLRPPDRATLIFWAAMLGSLGWALSSAAGLHPDGAILGFSGTMWAVWATTEKEQQRRHERRRTREARRRRVSDDDQGEEDDEDEGGDEGSNGSKGHKPWLA